MEDCPDNSPGQRLSPFTKVCRIIQFFNKGHSNKGHSETWMGITSSCSKLACRGWKHNNVNYIISSKAFPLLSAAVDREFGIGIVLRSWLLVHANLFFLLLLLLHVFFFFGTSDAKTNHIKMLVKNTKPFGCPRNIQCQLNFMSERMGVRKTLRKLCLCHNYK